MSELETPSSAVEQTATNTRVRSRFATRNRYLATIANSESNFAGEIKTLPVIGKPHEHGTTYEKG